jgi:LysM repeat protein
LLSTMRLHAGATAPARVKISRFGWSIPVAAIICLAGSKAVSAQDVRADAPAAHTVKRGDTLWDLAKTYLGDSYLWPSIYRLNTDQIEDPHWIYPGEILRLPGTAAPAAAIAAVEVEQPRRAVGPTVFTQVHMQRSLASQALPAPPAHVAIGDVISAAWVGPEKGPAGSGKVLFDADIPGIDMPRSTSNLEMYDKVVLVPPVGSIAAERERFVAYTLGESIENFGTVVIPIAVLQVVRAPRNGEAAIAQVVQLFGKLDAETRVIPLDTAGAGATGRPTPFRDSRTAKVKAIYKDAVLPSLNHEVLFDLAARDGMKIGDEIQIFRPREKEIQDERPAVPEVVIATGQVVRVTPFGATARITWQEQPAIRVGESVRLTARMP